MYEQKAGASMGDFNSQRQRNLLQRHLSDQVYKLLQCNFILIYVIVQRIKVSVAILTDLNLLPYQTAIIQ